MTRERSSWLLLVLALASNAALGCAGSVSSYAPAVLFDRAPAAPVVMPAHVADDVGDQPAPLSRVRQKVPVPSEVRLSNGVRVLLVERRGLPLVSATFMLRFDPHEASTVVPELYAHAMKGGSAEYSSQSIAVFMGAAGVTQHAGRGSDTIVVSARMLAPHAPDIIDRMSATVGAPSFENGDLKRAQHGLVAQRTNLRKYPNAVAAAQRMLLGEAHPARTRTFDLPQVHGASRDDLVRFERAHLCASNLTVALVGDFDRTEILRVLEARLGRLRGAPPLGNVEVRSPWREPAPPEQARIAIVPWRGATQSKIAVTFSGPHPRSDERAALMVLQVLLSASSGRLTMKIREEQGASYGIGAWINAWRTGSAFEISAAVEAARTVSAVRTIVEEVARLHAEPIAADELARAKGRVSAHMHGSGSALDRDAYMLQTIASQDLPLDSFVRLADQVDALTAEDVRAIAMKVLRADRMQIAVAADPAAVEAPLRALGIGDVSIAPPP